MGSRLCRNPFSNTSIIAALTTGAAKVYADASADADTGSKKIISESLPVTEEKEYFPYISSSSVHKRFRARIYDFDDMIYANKLSNLYYINHKQETKEKFNFFSEYLMDEPAIKKDRLLEAIDKYKKTPESIKYPLSVFFESAAKCFVPYNSE